ncbi:glycosyltransferase family 4 protein [Candidatus Thioglobus sp.]|nr:glycosyltransferase family 4 protein [Candidatus Thioglobus sp.]
MNGGAARAAYRLHRSLLEQGIDSQMLVQDKIGDDSTVIGPDSKFTKLLAKVRPTIDSLPVKFYRESAKSLFSPSWLGFNSISKKINDLNPDIVHLHWICGGMLRIEDLSTIKAPIVWSLHDMWPFTDGLHYCEDTSSYIKERGKSRALWSNNSGSLSRKVFKRKQNTYKKLNNLHIVGLSSWINNCSMSSTLLKEKKHINLPNPINANIFKPLDKSASKYIFNLPTDKKLVLFGAMDATTDPRKGFDELVKSLERLDRNDVELIVFGSSKPKEKSQISTRFKINYIGQLSDDVSLTILYNAVDVMVVPSLQENLSNSIMESLSCGVPVVAFDIGGNKDMVTHMKNGYLATPFDTQDLKNGINFILNHKNYNSISNNARNIVLQDFDSKIVSTRYIELYKSILNDC